MVIEAETSKERRRRLMVVAFRAVVGVGSFVIGVGIVVVVAALGDCSAFGGRCPRPSNLDGDIFGSAAIGAALAVGVPMFVARPSRKRFLVSLALAATIGCLVGAVVMYSTAG